MSLPSKYFDRLRNEGSLVLSNRLGKLVDSSECPVVKLLIVNDPFNPSQDVIESTDKENLIFGLVSENLNTAKEYFPSRYFDKTPYEGRPFYHGLLDCYTLLQDWYLRERGVVTPHNVERPWMWWTGKQSLYLQNAKEFGFSRVKGSVEVGDVFIYTFGSHIANHCGIYMGDNKILHHINGRFSCVEPITQMMNQHLIEIVRYKNA